MARMEIVESAVGGQVISEDMSQAAQNALLAAAAVVERKMKEQIEKSGLVDSGTLRDSIKPTAVKYENNSMTIDIYPQGSRKDGKKSKRNAEVGFYQNYGVTRSKGKSIIATHWFENAVDDSENEVAETIEQSISQALEGVLTDTLNNIF